MEYDPNKLIDALRVRLDLKNDALLSHALKLSPLLLSKIRHYALPVGGSILIRMQEVSGLSVRELRELMGDRRKTIRMSSSVSTLVIANGNSRHQYAVDASSASVALALKTIDFGRARPPVHKTRDICAAIA